MANTLYRKYRPKNFSEVIGQAHIVKTLGNSIKNNRIGHAYLFTGPRGTGKTSIARIFAKTINCESPKKEISCEKCSSCKLINEGVTLDIIEIDAASNTGVDNIRELRETVSLPPTKLKYKVYIIDEVHMLSTGAFNALLKTLEEPPAHVIFILATTEIHKVPQTILSRCQRFDFSMLPIQNIIEKLSLIARSEKIKIEKEALEMIAISAGGGMRDAESLLEQIISLEDKEITAKEVEEILGTTDQGMIFEITEDIFEKNSKGAIEKINKLLEDGYDLSVFSKSLLSVLRKIMLLKISDQLSGFFEYELTKEKMEKIKELSKKAELGLVLQAIGNFQEAQGKINSSILPQLPLEIAVIKTTRTFPAPKEGSEEKWTVSEKTEIPKKSSEKSPEKNTKKEPEVPAEESRRKEHVKDISEDYVRIKWNAIISEIRPYNHSLNALLSNCQVVKTEGNLITIATPYDFYREKLNDRENQLTIEKVFSKILESPARVVAVTDRSILPKKEELQKEEAPKEQDSLLKDAMEIMGGKIVEE